MTQTIMMVAAALAAAKSGNTNKARECLREANESEAVRPQANLVRSVPAMGTQPVREDAHVKWVTAGRPRPRQFKYWFQ